MKKIAILAAGAAALVSAPAMAAPGDTATEQGAATATIVAPISLTETATLAFGTITAGGGGTVVVTAAGAGSATGDVSLLSGSTETAGAFDVAGDATRSFSITTTGGTVTSGTDTMSFTTSASATSGTLDATGADDFTVGGTLTVPASAPAGTYTGDYDVTVAYS